MNQPQRAIPHLIYKFICVYIGFNVFYVRFYAFYIRFDVCYMRFDLFLFMFIRFYVFYLFYKLLADYSPPAGAFFLAKKHVPVV